MSIEKKKSRRDFLKGSAIAAGAGIAAINYIAPSSVLGANETIRMGIIGVGDRGSWGLQELKKRGAEIAAVCDVYEARRNRAIELSKTDEGKKADGYNEYEKILERKDIDAVYLACPDHWHHDTLIDAVKAGKDAYTEKPFSKTIQEGKEMVQAVRSTKQIVQVGNHRRSGEHWKRAQEVIRSGKIGKIVNVRVFDTRDWTQGDPWSAQIQAGLQGQLDWERFQGKAAKHAFDPYRYFTWRWYWDYAGGLMTDIGAHMLDVCQWLTDMDGPRSVSANGGNYFFKHWETPDTVSAILDYGTFSSVFTVEFINDYENVGAFYYGSEGTVVVDELKSEVRVHPRGEKKYEALRNLANQI